MSPRAIPMMRFAADSPSPWARNAMTPREYRILRDLPHDGLLTVGADGPRGPYWARFAPGGGRSVGPCPGATPFIAAMAAIEKGVSRAD